MYTKAVFAVLLAFSLSAVSQADPAARTRARRETDEEKIQNWVDVAQGDIFKEDELNSRKFFLLWRPLNNIQESVIENAYKELRDDFYSKKGTMNTEFNNIVSEWERTIRADPSKLDTNIASASRALDIAMFQWRKSNSATWNGQATRIRSLVNDYIKILHRQFIGPID